MIPDLVNADLSKLSAEDLRELLDLLRAMDVRDRRNRLAKYKPYAKQMEFHTAGAGYRERLFQAGNQLGKTWSGGAEVAMHMTGRYPSWWTGRRYNRPTRWMAGSESAELTKKGVQRILLGPPELREEWGTGMIPHELLKNTSPGFVPNAVSSASVIHEPTGDLSVISFHSYDQGRTKWQADTVDGVWFDEEPPLPIYSEGLTRTNATAGMTLVTFTPLLGMSDVVRRFLLEKPAGTTVVNMTIEHAEHYSPEDRARIIASYPEHEREARANGVPILGSGRVFPIVESAIKVESFRIPDHWPRLAAIDFGWEHPTAVVWIAWDRDTDTMYVYDVYRQKQEGVVVHAGSMRARGCDWIPVSWPHDGANKTAQGGGVSLAKQYKTHGIAMLPTRAEFAEGGNSLEAGVARLLERMQTMRLRVFSHLSDWFEEFRLYHRKDGKIVDVGDDLMSATRYAEMMLRFAKTPAEANQTRVTGVPAEQTLFGMLDDVAGY